MDFIAQPPQWLIDLAPAGVRAFLQGWGWWGILGFAALIVVLLLWALVSRLSRSRPEVAEEKDPLENLADFPPLPPSTGDRRLLVEGVPVRLRLVVLAPAGAASRIDPEDIEKLLESILPGLGDIALHDRPRVRVWPLQRSYEGFAHTFHRSTVFPEGEDQPSRWVMLAGRALVGKNQFMLGLGMQALKETTVGRKTLKAHDWAGLLRVRVRE